MDRGNGPAGDAAGVADQVPLFHSRIDDGDDDTRWHIVRDALGVN